MPRMWKLRNKNGDKNSAHPSGTLSNTIPSNKISGLQDMRYQRCKRKREDQPECGDGDGIVEPSCAKKSATCANAPVSCSTAPRVRLRDDFDDDISDASILASESSVVSYSTTASYKSFSKYKRRFTRSLANLLRPHKIDHSASHSDLRSAVLDSSRVSDNKTAPIHRVRRRNPVHASGGDRSLLQHVFSRSVASLSLHRNSSTSSITSATVCPGVDLSRQLALRDTGMSKTETSRQCILQELLNGEDALVDDLKCVEKNYLEPMRQLAILEPAHLHTLFYDIGRFTVLHKDLGNSLRALMIPLSPSVSSMKSDAPLSVFPSTGVGQVLSRWSPTLQEPCLDYCPHLVLARDLLDVRRDDGRLTDYLTRCIQSSFSRRLDLWSFLDAPRARMARYPLLVSRILDATDTRSEDVLGLRSALQTLSNVCSAVDEKTSQTRCKLVIGRVQLPHSLVSSLADNSGVEDNSFCQMVELMKRQNQLLMDGALRDHRGSKLMVFLMPEVLLITRSVSSINKSSSVVNPTSPAVTSCGFTCPEPRYRLVRKPLPTSQLVLEDMCELGQSEVTSGTPTGRSNSFKRRNAFRLWLESERHQSEKESLVTLHACSVHDKSQWMVRLRQVVSREHTATQSKQSSNYTTLRRWGSKLKSQQSVDGPASSLSTSLALSGSNNSNSRVKTKRKST